MSRWNTRLLLLPLGAFLAGAGNSEPEPCPLDGLEQSEYLHIDCQYFLGTTAYRAEAYGVAASHWILIQKLTPDYVGDDELVQSAKSNLAFLQYTGLGVPQDAVKAMANWEELALDGQPEAARHLGFAYTDKSIRDPVPEMALAWYKFAVEVIGRLEDQSQSETDVRDRAQAGIDELSETMNQQQLQKADIILAELRAKARDR